MHFTSPPPLPTTCPLLLPPDSSVQAAAEWALFLADIQAAQAVPRPSKPSEAVWRAGPHAARLQAVEALALGELPPVGEEYRLANKTLVELGKSPSGQVSGAGREAGGRGGMS